MSKQATTIRRSRPGHIRRRLRRGSVIIMVVGLLVLLALMGTIYITTARLDRYSAQQNATNVQIDLIVEGVVAMAQDPMVRDLFGHQVKPSVAFGDRIRPRSDLAIEQNTKYNFTNADATANEPDADLAGSDNFIASRLPLGELAAPQKISWPYITGPMIKGIPFQSPYNDGTTPTYTQRTAVQIYRASAPNAGLTINGVAYPCFFIGGKPVLAADTDGDGIPDAGLVPLPMGSINGVTFYAALRILDNNSAVNASIAFKPNNDTALRGQFFPSNVDLQGMLADASGAPTLSTLSSDMAALTKWRVGQDANGGWTATGWSLVPVDDSASNRPDYAFVSPYEALWSQLGRRPGNPGNYGNSTKYQWLRSADAGALAYRFMLANPSATRSTIEQKLSTTLSLANGNNGVPFKADDVGNWAFNYFPNNIKSSSTTWSATGTYPGGPYSRLALLTGFNPVSNLVPGISTSVGLPSGMAPLVSDSYGLNKISLNTAPFDQLWLGYWHVMSGHDGKVTPFGNAESFNPYVAPTNPAPAPVQKMFRPSLRDPRQSSKASFMAVNSVRFSSYNQMLLRAAIAAVNTLDLRDGDNDVTSQTVHLKAMVDGVEKDVDADVYGVEPQPFLTEVFVDTNSKPSPLDATKINKKGYVAIELYNPYPFDINVSNWKIAWLDRRASGGVYPNMKLAALTGGGALPGGTIITSKSYLVIENYAAAGAGANDATWRPAAANTTLSSLAAPAKVVFLSNLHEVIGDTDDASHPGGEAVLLRPRLKSNSASSSNAVADVYNEANLYDWVPVDQFDFTGLSLPSFTPPAAGPDTRNFTILHYVRANDAANAWKFVYPGRYDGTLPKQRQEGTEQTDYPAAGTPPTPPATAVALNLGLVDSTSSYVNKFLPIQLANKDTAGPNPATAATGNQFPYGAFARIGDIMQTPFIGRYRVRLSSPPTPDTILELNSVTMDAAFGDDGDTDYATSLDDDTRENIGRFCPFAEYTGTATSAPPGAITDTARTESTNFFNGYNVTVIAGSGAGQSGTVTSWSLVTKTMLINTGPGGWTTPLNNTSVYVLSRSLSYTWARRLFDYFTVFAPHDDYMPNVDPNKDQNTGNNKYPGPTPQPVANLDTSRVNMSTTPNEQTVGVEGLININTAPWSVIATLPMVVDGNGAIIHSQNNFLAQAIVAYRDAHGPYKSLFDLLSVSDASGTNTFANAWKTINFATTDPGNAEGDLSPQGGTDGVRGDFEETYLTLTRISNQVTLRSDTFTVYVLVQGWRNAGTTTPQLVVQRRVAFFADRTGVSASNRAVKISYFNNE